MGNFDEISRRPRNNNLNQQQTKPNVYEVPDESLGNEQHNFTQQEPEQNMFTKNSKQKLSKTALDRINKLIGLQEFSRVFKIGETEYCLRPLSKKQDTEVRLMATLANSLSNELDKQNEIFKITLTLLSYSLKSIGGVSFEDFIESTSLDAKIEFFNMLNNDVVLRMEQEYGIMVQEYQNQCLLKNKEEAEQVAEDLKKL